MQYANNRLHKMSTIKYSLYSANKKKLDDDYVHVSQYKAISAWR